MSICDLAGYGKGFIEWNSTAQDAVGKRLTLDEFHDEVIGADVK